MNSASYWRATARKVIEQALCDGRAAGLEGKALVAFVDARYPFGLRELHPYKIWLNERALRVFGVKRPMSRPRARKAAEAKKAAEVPGQGDLFGGAPS